MVKLIDVKKFKAILDKLISDVKTQTKDQKLVNKNQGNFAGDIRQANDDIFTFPSIDDY